MIDRVHTVLKVAENGVVGTFSVPVGPVPHPGVVAFSGSGGGVPSWWGELLAPRGIAVLAAAYFGVEPLSSALCEIPIETDAAAGEWMRRRPEVHGVDMGLVGGSKGAELALLAATAYPEFVRWRQSPSCVAWFGVDFTGDVSDASARSSWTLHGRPVPFVPPVPGIGTSGPSEAFVRWGSTPPRWNRPTRLLLPFGSSANRADLASVRGEDGACPSTAMAHTIVDRMNKHGRSADVRHRTSRVRSRRRAAWPSGQAPHTRFDTAYR